MDATTRRDAPAEVSPSELRAHIKTAASHNIASATLADAVRHHLSAHGKLLRGSIALDTALRMGLSDCTALCLGACVELLHNASLVHDDIQDADEIRRGQPALWSAFDVDTAICTGDHFIAAAYAALTHLDTPKRLGSLINLVSSAVSVAVSGQATDASVARAPCNTVESYSEVVSLKSGTLFALPAQLVFATVGNDAAVVLAGDTGRSFAVAYQIADDLTDELEDTSHAAARSSSLNILPVIRAQFGVADGLARRHAVDVARDQLLIARESALRLPAGSGARYVELADALARELS